MKRRTLLKGSPAACSLEAASTELARLSGVSTQILVMSRLISLIIAVVELLRALELRLVELICLVLILAASQSEIAAECRLVLISKCCLCWCLVCNEAAWLNGVSTQVLVMSRLIAAIVSGMVRRRRLVLRVERLLLILTIYGLYESSRLVRSLHTFVLRCYRRTERTGSKSCIACTEAGRLLGIRTQVLVMPRLVATVVGCLVRLLVIQSEALLMIWSPWRTISLCSCFHKIIRHKAFHIVSRKASRLCW